MKSRVVQGQNGHNHENRRGKTSYGIYIVVLIYTNDWIVQNIAFTN